MGGLPGFECPFLNSCPDLIAPCDDGAKSGTLDSTMNEGNCSGGGLHYLECGPLTEQLPSPPVLEMQLKAPPQ